ncbi:MAG: GAF domain-containing protein [Casimicrobiaceae bacterium]
MDRGAKTSRTNAAAKRSVARKSRAPGAATIRELETRLAEALEQQAATNEILRLMATSPGDVQPVLDAVAERAAHLCKAPFARVLLVDGDALHVLADYAVDGGRPLSAVPVVLKRTSISGRAVLDSEIIHHADIVPLLDAEFSDARENVRRIGCRAVLAVPLLREAGGFGAIFLWRREPGLFAPDQVDLVQTFARQAAIAIENVRLFKEVEVRNRDLSEALEQQTATSEILRAISSSPTNVQPVFDIIAERAGKLCDAEVAVVSRFDGTTIELAAIHGLVPDGVKIVRSLYPMKLTAQTVSARVIRGSAVVHIADVLAEQSYEIKDFARAARYRSALGVPIIRNRQVIGSIFVGRTKTGLFADSQVELLKTFSEQAVIAIENVRLFTELGSRNRELTEALEQQTATSEILRAISSSPTDVQPVFDIIGESAERLCDAEISVVSRIDGDLIQVVALHGVSAEGRESISRHFPMRLDAETITARSIRRRTVVHVSDALADPDYESKDAALAGGYRACLGVPMLREGEVTGAIFVARKRPGLFTDSQVQLLRTFADQAVIAIENVRLFTELEARNKDLTESLEQQMATSEILKVISASPTDTQPVFEAIARNSVALCGGMFANVFRFDGELVHWEASDQYASAALELLRSAYPMRPSRSQVSGRVLLSKCVVRLEDALADADFDHRFPTSGGWRRMLGVPMLRDGNPIGVIVVGWSEAGPIAKAQEELLKTFADQAVIAVENVRLFKELKARTTELTQSVGELKALGEVGQAVSSTLDLETVLRTIVARATELAGMDGGAIYEYDETNEQFYLHTAERYPAELVDVLRAKPIRKGEGALGRLAVVAEPVQIRNIAEDRTYRSRVRENLLRLGYRSLLAIPLVREDHLLGGLVVNRKTAGEFAPQVIDLLKTFATQSALAIQNARLFREIEDKGRQLEIASRHKSEFLANMSHELRTPLNAIIGFSEVLAERMFGEINEKQAEYLADILESGRHLLTLINDILDLSKIEAGRMELEPAEFSLPGAIDNALALVRERAQRREVRLARTIDPRVGTVHADERKVKQVLLNLLSNALKFTPEGGRIDVEAVVRDGMTQISVTDTGVGIAPEDLEAVFEEFRQVGTAAKKVEGTGLGLAISRKFIELHGGRIWVTSKPGVGSTFAFTLPRPGGAAG